MNKVIVTGCFGFIGSHIVKQLERNGDQVFGLGTRSNSESISSDFLNAKVSLSNLDTLLTAMPALPDVIYHFAGGSSVAGANLEPHLDFMKSVETASILFDWVRQNCPNAVVIVASSAAVYGSNAARALNENSQVNPFSNYGYHKEMVERLALMYRNNFGIKVIIARLFSVYGNGLQKQLLWDTCQKLSKLNSSDSLECFGSGDEERDWVHINDVCNTLIKCSELGAECPSVINVGSGEKNTVSTVISLLVDNWFSGAPEFNLTYNGISRVGDPFSLVSENTLANILYPNEKVSLADGIKHYVKWFKEYHER